MAKTNKRRLPLVLIINLAVGLLGVILLAAGLVFEYNWQIGAIIIGSLLILVTFLGRNHEPPDKTAKPG